MKRIHLFLISLLLSLNMFAVVNDYSSILVESSEFLSKDFCKTRRIEITAQQMNHIYSTLNVSKDEFVRDYQFVSSAVYDDSNGNHVTYTSSLSIDNCIVYSPNTSTQGITTSGITWCVSSDYAYAHQGEYCTATAVFVKDYETNHETIVVINFRSSEPFAVWNATAKDAYKLSDKVPSYWKADSNWNNGEEVAQLNAFVPNVGERDNAKCVFVKDLQDLFKKDGTSDLYSGIMDNISSDYKKGVAASINANSVIVKFKSGTCGKVNLTTNSDGTKLLSGSEEIAYLNGTIVTLNRNSTKAKTYLNTNELYATFTFLAKYETTCEQGEWKEVPNNGYPEFSVRFVRPLNCNNISTGFFEDGWDFGTFDFATYHTTLLPTAQTLSVTDWRGINIPTGLMEDGLHHYLYDYYGVQRVTVDNANVSTDIYAPGTGTRTLLRNYKDSQGNQVLKAGIIDDTAWSDPDLNPALTWAFINQMGLTQAETIDQFLYYRNNGALLENEFSLFFPIYISYTWGTMWNTVLEVKVKPLNYSSAIKEQKNVALQKPYAVYDITGRRVQGNVPQSGIYIVNGRKVVKH